MSAPESADTPPAPRGSRKSGPGEYSALVFVMAGMCALGAGLAESSAAVGLVTLVAFVPLVAVVYLICSRLFRER
ncbi:MAG TPA: hypothetical protein VIR27_17375 [Mycobacteriales bacterium]